MAASPGYAAFVAQEQEIDDDLTLVKGFADWLLAWGDAEDHGEWSADDYRAEWDHWNS
jgi:hypothetical protein